MEPALTYSRALEIAQGTEEAEKNLREMRGPQHECDTVGAQANSKQDPVHQITGGKQPRRQNLTCYCCGSPEHRIAECRFRDKSCQTCGKKGHLAKVCRSSGTSQPGTRRPQNQRQLRPICQVENEPGGDSEDSLEDVQVLQQIGGKLPPSKVTVQVDDCKIPMEIDTGASCL